MRWRLTVNARPVHAEYPSTPLSAARDQGPGYLLPPGSLRWIDVRLLRPAARTSPPAPGARRSRRASVDHRVAAVGEGEQVCAARRGCAALATTGMPSISSAEQLVVLALGAR